MNYYKAVVVSKGLVIEPPTTKAEASARIAEYADMLLRHHVVTDRRAAIYRAIAELKSDARVWHQGDDR